LNISTLNYEKNHPISKQQKWEKFGRELELGLAMVNHQPTCDIILELE